jgi:hypothetical protein
LLACFVEGAGAVNAFGSEAEFFRDGHLRGDALASLGFGEAASDEALELLFGLAPGDDEAVEGLVKARFDEEGGFNKDSVTRSGALPFGELLKSSFLDARMDDGVEAVEPAAVREDDSSELAAVDALVGGEDIGAEFLDDFAVSALAGFGELVGETVGVEYVKLQLTEHGSDHAFAASDAAGDAETKHALRLANSGGRLAGERAATGAAKASGFNGVAHEHGDGHWADATWNGRQGTGGLDGVGMDVADEHGAFGAEFFEALRKIVEKLFGFLRIHDFIGADIDDRGAGANPIGLDEAGFAHGGDDDVGAADELGKIARP